MKKLFFLTLFLSFKLLAQESVVEKGDEITRRSILSCLGYNLILKDQKINIELHPLFKTIFDNKKEAQQEVTPARTSQNSSTIRLNSVFDLQTITRLRG